MATLWLFATVAMSATAQMDKPIFELVKALDHPVIGQAEGKRHNINAGFEGTVRRVPVHTILILIIMPPSPSFF